MPPGAAGGEVGAAGVGAVSRRKARGEAALRAACGVIVPAVTALRRSARCCARVKARVWAFAFAFERSARVCARVNAFEFVSVRVLRLPLTVLPCVKRCVRRTERLIDVPRWTVAKLAERPLTCGEKLRPACDVKVRPPPPPPILPMDRAPPPPPKCAAPPPPKCAPPPPICAPPPPPICAPPPPPI